MLNKLISNQRKDIKNIDSYGKLNFSNKKIEKNIRGDIW